MARLVSAPSSDERYRERRLVINVKGPIMSGKRIVFTGGTGKAGRHAVPHLLSKGYSILNVDLKPLDLPGVNTLIADLTDSGQAFNALTTHFGFDGFEKGAAAGPPDAVVHFAA